MEFRFSIKEKRVLSFPPPPPCDETKTRNGRNDKNCGSRTSNVPEQSIKFSNRIYHWALVHQTSFDINKNSGSSVRWIAVIAAVHFSPLSFPLDRRPFHPSPPIPRLWQIVHPSLLYHSIPFFVHPFAPLIYRDTERNSCFPSRFKGVNLLEVPPPWNRINEGRFRS